jgi:glycerol-3-phosphate dehydrogenase
VQKSTSDRLAPPKQAFDVLVIGGGINGVAIARECARAGKKVLIVEQHDFASGTTSRSTRIIHGGLRYLEHGEIGLVRESLRERDRLLCESPHLVRPMQFLLALPKDERPFMRSSLAVRTGLWLYHRWAGVHAGIPRGSREFERQLDSGGSWSVYSYEDAQCEFPERLVAEWLAEATRSGATARNYTQVLEILSANGKVTGARLRDTLSGAESAIAAKQVVNAAGPWIDHVIHHSSINVNKMIGGVRGSHIVLPTFPGSPTAAIYTEAVDGRPFFVIPWNGQVLVGTTEVADSGNPADAQPSLAEIDYLYDSFVHLFPRSSLIKADIRYSFAGIRPLPFSPGEKMSAVTRRHIIHDHQQDGAAGLFSIIGGKLSTAASLARDAVRKLGIPVTEPANVFAAPAPANGIQSTFKQWSRFVACRARIPESCAQSMASWHGRRALAIAASAAQDERLRMPICEHTCHIVAEALEAVHYESAVTLADILLRRVPIGLGPCWSEPCSQQAASRIGEALGWNEVAIGEEFERFELERNRFLHPRQESVAIG